MDVGGEITEIVLIRDGFLEEVSSFGRGGNFLVRRIASFFHLSLEEAGSLLKQYSKSRLSSSKAEEVSRLVKDSAKEWCQFFNEFLRDFTKISLLPQRIFLLGQAAVLPELTECLADKSLEQFTIGKKPFVVKRLLPEALSAESIKGINIDDAFLKLIALFTHYAFQKTAK